MLALTMFDSAYDVYAAIGKTAAEHVCFDCRTQPYIGTMNTETRLEFISKVLQPNLAGQDSDTMQEQAIQHQPQSFIARPLSMFLKCVYSKLISYMDIAILTFQTKGVRREAKGSHQ